MTYAEYRRTRRRIEMWDSRSETAFEAREPLGIVHDWGVSGLSELIHRIDRARGASCRCVGSTDLRKRSSAGGALQPDESVYLDARRAGRIRKGAGRYRWIEVDAGEVPDVVLEVDHTTDARRGKLQRYEDWAVPEVWVEGPDVPKGPDVPYAEPGRQPAGLRIYLLEEGRYRESDVSRAFPGWRAEEIHRGLNETEMTAATLGALDRVGRTLAARDGTSPEDDPQTRAFVEQGREEGAVSNCLGLLGSFLGERGIAPDPTFPERLTAADRRLIAAARAEAVLHAAGEAANEDDFVRRLRADP